MAKSHEREMDDGEPVGAEQTGTLSARGPNVSQQHERSLCLIKRRSSIYQQIITMLFQNVRKHPPEEHQH